MPCCDVNQCSQDSIDYILILQPNIYVKGKPIPRPFTSRFTTPVINKSAEEKPDKTVRNKFNRTGESIIIGCERGTKENGGERAYESTL